ncbi:MAG: N-glycosylase/DNA lyase [Candidatus Woesearchaeota archaeon]
MKPKEFELIKKIENLKKTSIKKKINSRIREFEDILRKRNYNKIMSELFFCILTANFNAERSIKIQNTIGDDFLKLRDYELASRLKDCGHRFPNTRANFICNARERKKEIIEKIKSINENHGEHEEHEIREWLVKNIKGIGYKEASHFLRNIGFKNLAIIDFHIVDILERHKIIKRPKNLGKKNYLKIESVLKEIAGKTNLSLAELDLYLWFLETGKILK